LLEVVEEVHNTTLEVVEQGVIEIPMRPKHLVEIVQPNQYMQRHRLLQLQYKLGLVVMVENMSMLKRLPLALHKQSILINRVVMEKILFLARSLQ
jgi:hypothetical protein